MSGTEYTWDGFWSVELVRDRRTREPFAADAKLTAAVVGAGLAHGAFFYPGGCAPAQDVVVLGPPLNASDEELDACAGLLRKSLDAALARLGARA